MMAIITGGTGFIGYHLTREMVKNGYNVILIVRKKDDRWKDSYSVQQLLYNSVELEQYLNGTNNVDVFFHIAWGGVSTALKNDVDIQLQNIQIGMDMVLLASRLKVKKFIGAGTVAEYAFEEGVVDFEKKQTPSDLYGAAKTAAHYMMQTYARTLNLDFIWTVIPSTYGEGRESSNILSYTITKLLKGEIPEYGNLDQVWDFLYVGDVVRALRLIGEYGQPYEIYGIGSGEYRPLREYVEEIRDLINPTMKLGIGVKREQGLKIESSCVDISKLVSDTGFKPMYTFEEGITRTITAYKEAMGVHL